MNLLGNHHLRWWGVFAVALLGGAAAYALVPPLRIQELAFAWVAGWWTFTHFQHQHTLEKSRFFFDLFKQFNDRYNKLNDDLQRIAAGEGILSSAERARIVDYFNLCAEEFLFYQRGYVPEDVYRAWRNGMNWYASKERFVKVWREECATDSYYGFEFSS
jgi:hypothetical protein